jgi:serine phosphatase RsbU (regulator of sigma subunit)
MMRVSMFLKLIGRYNPLFTRSYCTGKTDEVEVEVVVEVEVEVEEVEEVEEEEEDEVVVEVEVEEEEEVEVVEEVEDEVEEEVEVDEEVDEEVEVVVWLFFCSVVPMKLVKTSSALTSFNNLQTILLFLLSTW